MKKVTISAIFISLSMVLTANTVFAKGASLEEKAKHEGNITKTMFQFIAMGLGSYGLHKTSQATGCDMTTKAVLQLSNVMVQGGVIFGKPVLTDLGFRSLLASGAASLANNPMVKGNLANIPFVGQHLKDAGTKGVAITTVAFYELYRNGYIAVIDGMPASVQDLVRGE